MAVVQHDVQSGKHPVLASVLMGILRALDDESTGKSSSSSEDATCQLHDRGGPPCRRLRHGKSSQAEMKKAEEYIIPPDEEMAPMPDFSLSDSIRTPPGSPQLQTIIETEEEGEDGDKKEESLIAERAEFSEEKKMDAVKNLQKEEVKVRSSTSSPLVTSDDSDVAAFLSKDEYATLFGPNSVNSDKILIPSRFVQDYGETSSSVQISQKSPLKRGSGEELQGNQVKKQKSDHKPVGSSLEALGGTGVHSDKTKETDSSLGIPSQRKSPKTEEESDFSSEETLSDTMSDDTVEESTASSILDDRQVGAPGRRKKKLTKTLKSLRIDSPDADGMSDLFSDGQMRNLRPSMMPGPKLVLGSNGWKSDARNEAKSILQKAVSTSLEDFSDMLSPDQSSTVHRGGQGKTDTSEPVGSGSLHEVSVSGGTMTENVSSIVTDPSGEGSPVTLSVDMSDKKYKSETSDSKFTSSASQSLSASVSTGKSQKFSQSEATTDVTREEYMSSINESKSAVEDVRQSESSYISGTTVSSELRRVLTTSEKLSASSAQPSVPPSELESSVISSNLTSATSKEDTASPPIGTSITSETNDSISSYIPELSKKVEVPSSDVLTLSSSLSTASKSGTSSSKLSGIDPRDLPAILRTGTQQPLIIPLNDIYSSMTVSHISNTSSNATTHMQESDKTGDSASIRNTSQLSSDVYSTSITTSSAGSKTPPAGGTTTPTESSEAHGDLRSQPSHSLEMSYHPSDYTKAGGSAYSSSVTNSIATSRTSRSEAESTTDVANEPMLLTNVVLTEALLRSEPSRSDFEESDILTSSSDEFITHRLMPDTFHSHDRGFLETSSVITGATESMDIGPRDVPREENVEEPTGEKLDTIIDENTVQEIPWLTDVQSGYLPVLLEESEESDDNIHTKVEEVEKSDASAFSDLEEGDIRDTSALQQQFSMIRVSESSTTNGDKSSSDDQAQHLLMIDIDGNETIFDDKLITGDTSISSISSEYLPIKMPEALPLISSEHVKYDFTETECAREIVHYVTLNAVATVVVEIVVNASIARLTDELDFSLQMEKALFPGIEEEDGDGLIHKHWIAPARYRQKGYAQSQSFEGKGYGGYKWERSCKHRDRDAEEEAFLLCLERAFFPCLADSDDRGIGRSSSPLESEYQPSPKVSLKAKVDKTDWKTKLCKSCQLVIMTSRVSTVAVGTLSQIWSIVTHWWWMIWIYIRDNCKVSKVKRKDQSSQYDEDLATFRSQTGVVIGISDEECSSVQESSTRVPKVSGWEQSDELSLNIKACRIVVSAVTGALWGKEYALSSSSSGLHRKSQPRGDDLSTTPPNGKSLVTQQFDEEYRLRLSATNVIEEDNGNGFVMNDSIRASASATPTEDSNQSEDTSLCSETDSKVDSDATGISSCSLSDITFMRQQLAEMRDIFQTHISGVQANAFSTPAVAPIPTEDAVFSSSYLEESAVCRDMTMIRDEIDGANKSVSSTKTREKGKTAAGNERIPVVDVCTNVDSQKSRKQSPKLDKSLKASKADYNPTMSEHVKEDLELSSSKETESCKKDMFESKIVYSKLETRQGETGILDEKNEVQNKIDEPLQHLPRSELHGEEAVNIKDTGECDSNSNDSSVISISDDHLSGISFIREQLANVKTLATSIMDDFDSYAEERALLAKRSSQLTCSGVLVRSQSSSDSARTIHNKSSGSSSSLNLNRDSKLGESKEFSSHEENNELREYTPDLDQDSKEDDTLVGMRKAHVVSQISGSLGLPNKNGNAKTRKSGLGAEDYAKNEEQRDHLKCENTKEKGYTNETSKRQAALVGKKQTHSGTKATKETVTESLQVIGEDDQTRSLRMTETHQTRQIATFQRNSPIRRHVTPRKKEVNHPHGTYSGESTCSTDHSSSIVSRPSSSFSDGSVSSGSKRVTIESESQGRGTTDVSCRISDRGVWVNTAFVNVIDEDHLGNTSIAADSGRSSATTIKNKIMINVKTSQKNRKKHQSHRVRAGVRDTQLQLTPEENQRALAILDEESLEKKSQDMTKNKMSTNVREEVIHRSEAKSSKTVAEDSHTTDINAHDEVIEAKNCQRQSNRSSPKYEMSEEKRHGAMQLSDKLTPRKKSSSDSQCSEEYEKAVSKSTWNANQEHVMRDCVSDGAVSEKQQFLNRRQPSPKRKTRETEKLQDRSCHSCAEKSDHAEDLLAAPVISRSERTKAVLSMLDDVADNLSLDTSAHDNSGRARTMGRMGSFRKLFHSRKNKRRNGGKIPDHSPRVLSDSSVTESDGDSGSPSYSSDSSHTPRSSSAASLLSNVLRNLSARRSKKKSKGTSSRTPKDRRSKKGSIAAFDEMLADLDDDCFIDDAFPSLVSVRDSASEDNTSLKEVLQDLIEEWSFDGLQEAIDFSPQSIGDRIRGKLNQFMAEVRKEKRRAELLFARARTL